MKKFNFLILCLLMFSWTQAQFGSKSCGHTEVTNELWKQQPELEQNYRKMVQEILKKKNAITSKSITVTIPIVFHVIHEYGMENITDAQIYDAVAILNEDYRKMNADTSSVIPEFRQLIADCKIQFSLPTIDFLGNCTNGIEHYYSHETNIGDDFSKIHQWKRGQYLNIWVVKSMRNGVAGYAYYPSDITLANSFADGVIILSDYIGSIGTGSSGTSRALTHEIGHYLGLSHPWGSTNSPGVACGDDDIPDTPITKGFSSCPSSNQAKICDPTIVENFQNYMDYSYCSHMFTLDQSLLMNSVLSSAEAYRPYLVSDQNMIETGVNISPAPTCLPVADFASSQKFVCISDNVNFDDVSWNAPVVNRIWTFQDGVPSSSTVAKPSVSFSSPGWKTVTLIVNNTTGSDTLVWKDYLYVGQPVAQITGVASETFDVDHSKWSTFNLEKSDSKFTFDAVHGKNLTPCFMIKNFFTVPNDPISDYEEFYTRRLGGNKNALISPSFDLSGNSNVSLEFEYAYGTQAIKSEDMTEVLNVYSSKNCGKTWTLRKAISGAELLTAGNFAPEFYPNSYIYWKTASIPLTSINSTDVNTIFKFEFVSSDYSNNFFIDNINVYGILEVADNPLSKMDFEVYPNPVSGSEELKISYKGNGQTVRFELTGLSGQLIHSEERSDLDQQTEFSLRPKQALASGYYLLNIKQGNYTKTSKIVVL